MHWLLVCLMPVCFLNAARRSLSSACGSHEYSSALFAVQGVLLKSVVNVINRPGVAGTVLQIALPLIKSLRGYLRKLVKKTSVLKKNFSHIW